MVKKGIIIIKGISKDNLVNQKFVFDGFQEAHPTFSQVNLLKKAQDYG